MPETDPKAALRDIWSVSRINREARAVLTGAFPLLWVEGEISNLKRYRSGHWYFSLKDEAAQVSCAMFRNRNALVDFLPDDGMRVMIRARVELYENRGQFQLIAEHMEEAGEGALRRAFEQLKNKLNAEGLFDTARKREIPRLPARIAVVTSPDGAAIKDILSVLGRRFPAIPVDIYGVSVQGDKAAPEIAHALDAVAAHGKAELVILARGGGSLEDLWAFNEELVARAIVDCPVPVISGVGHEVDFTIADFVADRRAPTPSAAAEAAVPDRQDLNALLNRDLGRLRHWRGNKFTHAEHRLSNLQQRLQSRSPSAQLQQRAQRLDELDQRLRNALPRVIQKRKDNLAVLAHRLHQRDPNRILSGHADRIRDLTKRLKLTARLNLPHQREAIGHARQSLTRWAERTERQERDALAALASRLDAVSPLATLKRGYAMVTDTSSGKVIDNSESLEVGQEIEAHLGHGSLRAEVTALIPSEKAPTDAKN